MNKRILTPEVNPSREFLEIASDFSNPLDIVREALSNAFDAKATDIYLLFTVFSERGKRKLKIVIRDNGNGMDYLGLKSFFDLGNSLRKDQKEADESLIGEKGHGTKIYFNSESVSVTTGKNDRKYVAIMEDPIGLLYDGQVPIVDVTEENCEFKGTYIEIIGYNGNERAIFNHDRLRDYIYWFTKFGSFEREIYKETPYDNIKLHIQGIDKDELETLSFGHRFPEESASLDKLIDLYLADAPDYYVKKMVYTGHLKKYPDINYQAVFYIEGNKAKRHINNMIRRSGYTAPDGSYRVQERYGIWLSKDFIPIQQKNEWITSKGSEYTKFHAFFNCQELRLTANRGSVDNTPAEILDEIQVTVRDIYKQITDSNEWGDLEWLEEQSQAYQSEKKEERDYEKRKKLIKSGKLVHYKGKILREPRQEHGVFTIYHTVDLLEPNLFPFEIIDYDTHAGIDVLARLRNTGVDLDRSFLRFVEFKYTLKHSFNHSFKRLYGLVCWKLSLKNDELVADVFGNVRKLRCIPKSDESNFTQYFLEDDRDPHRIEVIVLEEYLQERLNIVFQRMKQ